MYQFKNNEYGKSLQQLVEIYENQIINSGTKEYIDGIAELIEERYLAGGLSDFNVPDGGNEATDIGREYEEFEQKVRNIIRFYRTGQPWVISRERLRELRGY